MDKFIYDDGGAVVSTVHVDNTTGSMIVHDYQDAGPILENNKRLQTLNDGYSPSREMRRIASIPTNLAMQWVTEAGIKPAVFWKWPKRKQNEFFRKRYMSSDYAHLRTAPVINKRFI